MRWGVPKQKRHCAAYGGISHRVIIIQKQKDFVIDVGQVIYQHRHDRMRMEQQAVSPLARMWLGEAPIGLMLETSHRRGRRRYARSTIRSGCAGAPPTSSLAAAPARESTLAFLRGILEEVRFALNSPLEGDGFEPSVPRLR